MPCKILSGLLVGIVDDWNRIVDLALVVGGTEVMDGATVEELNKKMNNKL